MDINEKVDVIGSALNDIKDAIIAKGATPEGNITTYAAAIGDIHEATVQDKTLVVDETTPTVVSMNADSGYDGIETATFDNGYVSNRLGGVLGSRSVPVDTLNISQNGTYSVLQYANAEVNVESGGGGGGGFSRNIGELVPSTLPLADAGLRPLDGSLVSGEGSYADFVEYIADLYGDGTNVPAYFCTETEWQTAVDAYGVCGKFVYTPAVPALYAWKDEQDNVIYTLSDTPEVGDSIYVEEDGDIVEAEGISVTSFAEDVITYTDEEEVEVSSARDTENDIEGEAATVRLPKITGIIEGTISLSALGDLVQAGLPSHTHTRGTMNITGGYVQTRIWKDSPYSAYTGAFYAAGNGGDLYGSGGIDSHYAYFDASRSWTGSTSTANYSSTLQTSTTVQPQTVKVFYYIVVANTVKTEIQVDIDEIATDLNGKAGVDLVNCTNVGTGKMVHNAMPSKTFTNLNIGASGTSYTAPADGYFTVVSSACTLLSIENWFGNCFWTVTGSSGYQRGSVPVKKGDAVVVYYSGTVDSIRFVYAEGNKWEAS